MLWESNTLQKQQLFIHTFEIRRLAFSKMAYECDNHNPRCQGSHNFWHFEQKHGGSKNKHAWSKKELVDNHE